MGTRISYYAEGEWEAMASEGKGPNPYISGAICLFVLGVALMAMAVQAGEAEVGIFLIFPFVMGGGLYMGLGMLMVVIGLVLLVVGLASRFALVPMEEHFEEEGGRRQGARREGGRTVGDREVSARRVGGGVKGGGVVFIGPIPIIWGSNAHVTRYMLYLAVVVVIGMCLLFFYLSLRGI